MRRGGRAKSRRFSIERRSMAGRSGPKVDLLQQERHRQQRGGEQREKGEDVDIGEVGGLIHQRLPHPADRLMLGLRLGGALMSKIARRLLQSLAIGGRGAVDIFGEPRLMKLLSSGE